MNMAKALEKRWGGRLGIYLTGMLSVSLGIVLCVKCEMGISPISSWPYVLSYALPLSFGTLTMLFHLLNIILQFILQRRIRDIRIWLQVPVAVIFGRIIDIFQKFVVIDSSFWTYRCLALLLSILFTAFGMVCMINMQLVQNPPDGTVHLLSRKTGIEMGKVKIVYDVIMMSGSVVFSLVAFGKMVGLGIATIASAIFVGKTVSWIQKYIGSNLKERFDRENNPLKI